MTVPLATNLSVRCSGCAHMYRREHVVWVHCGPSCQREPFCRDCIDLFSRPTRVLPAPPPFTGAEVECAFDQIVPDNPYEP